MNENSNSSIVLAEGVHKTYDAGRVKVAALRNYLKILVSWFWCVRITSL